jgi:hypothetical protein
MLALAMLANRTTRRFGAVLALGCALSLTSRVASARPGGGHTYSGSSSSSSSSSSDSSGSWSSRSSSSSSDWSSSDWSSSTSGSSSDGGDRAFGEFLLFLLTHPVGGLLVVGLLTFVIINARREGGMSPSGWHSSTPAPEPRKKLPEPSHVQLDRLTRLKKFDPGFSVVLFEDFLYALYAEAQIARGSGTIGKLSPWLSVEVRERLAQRAADGVDGIVIGALRYLSVEGLSTKTGDVELRVEIEANYSEGARGSGDRKRYYVRERWTLGRDKRARSRPPEKVRAFGCPNCGAALDKLVGRDCGYCKRQVDTTEFDWIVRQVSLLQRESRPPALGGHAEERATDRPTVEHPKAKLRWKKLRAKDPQLSLAKLRARVELVFDRLHAGWAARDLLCIRPYVTDAQLQSLSYWLDAYRRQKLRNVTDEPRITELELTRVVSDAHYDAVTLRIFASGRDYTETEAGALVGGSRSIDRDYSEYWTLIRGCGRRGAPSADEVCPNCGAPLEIEMTGQCTHCNAKLTSGEFDWVLSRIEQDDAY